MLLLMELQKPMDKVNVLKISFFFPQEEQGEWEMENTEVHMHVGTRILCT